MIIDIKADSELQNKQRSKFIMKCTLNDCPTLSPKYKCSICDNYTCKDCLEQVGDFENFENHTFISQLIIKLWSINF